MADLLVMLSVLVGSFVVGYLLISKVPPMLHTPLMSMTNAISAITIVGALLLFASQASPAATVIGMVALLTAAFNVVGGFVITDRMLKLFRQKPRGQDAAEENARLR